MKVLKVDAMNANGWMYPRDVIEQAIANMKPSLPVATEIGIPVQLSNIIGTASDARIDEDGWVSMEITPCTKMLEDLLASGFDVVAIGTANLDDNGLASNYQFDHTAVLPPGTRVSYET